MRLAHLVRWGGLVALLAVFAALGCSDPSQARAVVKGNVKFFDKHLTAGTVSFIAADGRVGSGNIDFDGNYVVHDAPVGDTKVIVSVPKMGMGPAGKGPSPKPPPGVPPMHSPDGSQGGNAPEDVGIDPNKIVKIPAKYEKTESSGLSFKVEKGENTYNITLTP